MNEKLKLLIAQATLKHSEANALLAKGDAITAEDVVKVTELNTEIEGLKKQIEAFKSVSDLRSQLDGHNAFLNQPATTPTQPILSPGGVYMPAQMLGFAQAGYSEIVTNGKGESVLYSEGEGLLDEKQIKAISSPEYKRAFRSYLRKKGVLADMSPAEVKTLQEGADSGGGFLVPEDLLNRIIAKKPTPTRVASNTTQLTTSRDALTIPKVNYTTDDIYTTGMRVTWTGEVPSSSTVHRVTEPVFGAARIPINTAMMSMPLTNDLIEDNAFGLEAWVSSKFQETNSLLEDNMVLNGTGLGQPSGILLNPGGTGQPAVISMGNPMTADNIEGMPFNIPEQYEDGSKWVFNKTSTAKYIATLKDSQNRYLWGQGYQDSGLTPGRPTSLGGYPFLLSGFMPSTGANNYPIIHGDLEGYYLVRRVGFAIRFLTELYAETNQILVLGRVRLGGQVCEDWRMKIGQQA